MPQQDTPNSNGAPEVVVGLSKADAEYLLKFFERDQEMALMLLQRVANKEKPGPVLGLLVKQTQVWSRMIKTFREAVKC